MQRPSIAASSATEYSQSSTTAKLPRTSSTRQSTRPGMPSITSLLITNIRLLDFDLLPDWPAITTASLGNQDARARIRCTEFALFHLFRLYDPATTAEKLQPFFPPLEPLQSINLRAALYRCLNELKKNGVLGKEAVLRKTMLDECQGDKFWELCLGFSATVVRKMVSEKKSRCVRPEAEKIGTSRSVSKSQRESMLPLAIAHKVALSRLLDVKLSRKDTYARLYEVLLEKEEDLMRRRTLAEEKKRLTPSSAQFEKLEGLEQHMTTQWVGSRRLHDALVRGEMTFAGDEILSRPLDVLATAGDAGPPSADDYRALVELEGASKEQAQRLRALQAIYDRLLASKPVSAQSIRGDDTTRSELRFDSHRDLMVRGDAPSTAPDSRQRSSTHSGEAHYDDILTSMREELRKARRSNPALAAVSMSQVESEQSRKPRMSVDTTVGATRLRQPSPSQRASGRRGLVRSLSLRPRSYQQPKVESQRQPIPLKSELFSPLRDIRRTSTSPLFSTSMIASPSDALPPSASKDDTGLPEDAARLSQSGEANGNLYDRVEIKLESPLLANDMNSPEQAAGVGEDFKASYITDLPEIKPAISTNTTRPSLADRTRMSMAFTIPEDSTPCTRKTASIEPTLDDLQGHQDNEIATDRQNSDSRASLLDRTRQSISLAPPPSTQPKHKISHTRSRTSVNITIPFNTSEHYRRSSTTTGQHSKRDITPRESLFSPGAEYDSVFRSRPKIALSPVLSPRVDSKRISLGSNGGLDLHELEKRSSRVWLSAEH